VLCNKQIYETKKKAKIKKRQEQVRLWKKLWIYKCLFCDWYHLTHKVSLKNKIYFRSEHFRRYELRLALQNAKNDYNEIN